MLHKVSSKYIPNQLFKEETHDQYEKSKKVKGKIRNNGPKRNAFEDITNKNQEENDGFIKISKITHEKPKKLDLNISESQQEESDGQSCKPLNEKLSENRQCSTPKQISMVQKQAKQIRESQQKEYSSKNNIIQRKLSQSSSKLQLKLEQSESIRKAPVLQRFLKKNIFNLNFDQGSESSEQSHENQQITEKNSDFQEKQKIQEPEQPLRMKKRNENLMKLLIDDSDSSEQSESVAQIQQKETQKEEMLEQEQSSEQQAQKIYKKEKSMEEVKGAEQIKQIKKRFLFDDSDIEDSDDETGTNNNTEEDLIIREKQIEDLGVLEILKKINIQKIINLHEYDNNSNENKDKYKYDYIANKTIPEGYVYSMLIKRNQETSQYSAYDDQLVKHVIGVRKNGSTYKFYVRKKQQMPSARNSKKKGDKNHQISQVVIAKMKSNFLGTQFHCYLLAENSSDKKKQKKYCISIKYETNILGLNGPRKITIYTPEKTSHQSQKNLMQIYEGNQHKTEGMIKKFLNKAPKWCPEINAYVLDFKGRATRSSVKNCIISDENLIKQYLVFGKVSKDVFNLDVKDKFSIVQGLALAVSSFQKKLGCQ